MMLICFTSLPLASPCCQWAKCPKWVGIHPDFNKTTGEDNDDIILLCIIHHCLSAVGDSRCGKDKCGRTIHSIDDTFILGELDEKFSSVQLDFSAQTLALICDIVTRRGSIPKNEYF